MGTMRIILGILTVTSAIFSKPSVLEKTEPETCYHKVGCFSNLPPWRSTLRPILLPEPPEQVCTNIILYTPTVSNLTLAIYPDITKAFDMVFISALPVILLVHGWTNSGYDTWLAEIANALLKRVEVNVIIVDWAKGANGSYQQSVSNLRVMAAVVNLVMDHINELGVLNSHVHIIGHSLGAHGGAYVAKREREKNRVIGRLTGLDPAGPLFGGCPKELRFAQRDAAFTETIRTNVGLLGIIGKMGDFDSYANGGTLQPNCRTNQDTSPDVLLYKSNGIESCSHNMAHVFYREMIMNPYCYVARPGTPLNILKARLNSATSAGYYGFTGVNKNCNETQCVPLGLESVACNPKGKFVFTTKNIPPYCTG